ncbi:hypothetical protein TIFTF001_031732 [Ficus carica]|uniref:Uncharacterized protein n=1 Tax=Ficus carica TaxID=3494 RepID=A0AA88J1F2_FICCA|nr:hypothetical protein TIFTF001_031732 [Ficus carica]
MLPRWFLKTIVEDKAFTTVYKDRRGSTVLPRRSPKTVVEARSVHDGLKRPSWKHVASMKVSN